MNAHVRAGLVTLVFSILVFFAFRYWRSGADPVDQSIQAYQELEARGIPGYGFESLEGRKFNLTDFSSGVLIITFWASWCGPCVEEFPSLVRLLELNSNVKIVAVSGDYKVSEIHSFLSSVISNGPNDSKGSDAKTEGLRVKRNSDFESRLLVTWDKSSEFRKKFGVLRLPEAFIFLNGKLVRKVVGSIDWADKDALKFFSELK